MAPSAEMTYYTSINDNHLKDDLKEDSVLGRGKILPYKLHQSYTRCTNCSILIYVLQSLEIKCREIQKTETFF